MERTLSLVLDERCLVSLTLYKADNFKMDKYTIDNFENSDDIRKKYKKEIDEFLEENKKLVDAIKAKLGREYKGRIVLLQVDSLNIMNLEQKRVLYKGQPDLFNKLCSDERVMKEFLRLEQLDCNLGRKPLISQFDKDWIKNSRNFAYSTRINEFKKRLKNYDNFYDILRVILKASENVEKLRRQERARRLEEERIEHQWQEVQATLDGLNEFENQDNIRNAINELQGFREEVINGVRYYNDDDNQISFDFVKQEEPKVVEPEIEEDEKTINLNGFTYTQEEQELFDLDELNRIEEKDFEPDGLDKHGKSVK